MTCKRPWWTLDPGPQMGSTLEVEFGRTLVISARAGGACRFSFDELCGRSPGSQALGPADYLALAKAASTLYLSGVPVLTPAMRNEARRFVTLVDALYEANRAKACPHVCIV